MRDSERRDLEGRLAAMTSNEKQKLYKRAAAARQREQGMKKRREGARGRPLDEWALALLREEEPEEQPLRDDGDRAGTVVWVGLAACHVRERAGERGDERGSERAACEAREARREAGGEESLAPALSPGSSGGAGVIECALPPDLRGGAVAVGDEVSFIAGEGARVTGVRPRRTVLSRPDPHNAHRELVIAANVDVVVIVAALVSPPLRPGLIDRFLVAVQRGGAAAAICASKADLVPEAERAAALEVLRPYVSLGIPVVLASATTGEGIDAVRALVAGRTSALVGHSGVGKSSLANALHPELAAATGTVSEHHGRGRHTTTAAALHFLPDGSRVVDTPGIRGFGLWNVSAGELARYFPEMDEPAGSCRFGDCTHTHEPSCGVRAAVEAGAVAGARYDAYLRILGTIRD